MNTRPIAFLDKPFVLTLQHLVMCSQPHHVQLHTLEDFPAHSNFCELALVSMDHSNVFVHVGDYVRIQAPNGRWVAPLVTGTFGSSDFLHSLLGGMFAMHVDTFYLSCDNAEATDHLVSASYSRYV
jgi:Heterokaryon incompatibility protein Het-C